MKEHSPRSLDVPVKTNKEVAPDLFEKKLSKSARRNLKKKMAREAKRDLKTNGQVKPVAMPVLPSSIILPEQSKVDNPLALDDLSLLSEIKRRICEQNALTVKIAPVPKRCPPLLLYDLCPKAVAVRIPSKPSSRYAFVEFASALEAKIMAENLTGKNLDGKPIAALVCSDRSVKEQSEWKTLTDRGIDAFDLTSLYVSRLSRFTERTALAQIFRTASKIELESFPDGTCKGFCILKYKSRELAQKAFVELHGTLLKGTPIAINFLIKSKEKNVVNKNYRMDLKRKLPDDNQDNGIIRLEMKRRMEENQHNIKRIHTDALKIEKCRVAKKSDIFSKKLDKPEFSLKLKPDNIKAKNLRLKPYQLTRKSERKLKKKA